MELNRVILWGAIGLGVSQIPFIINLFYSIKNGKKVPNDNPWDATTLEWQTETPPYVYNFRRSRWCIVALMNTACPVMRQAILLPQTEPDSGKSIDLIHMDIPYTTKPRPDTGLYNAKLGMWLFLASEVMLFGGLFSAYIYLRVGAPAGTWPHGLVERATRHDQHCHPRTLSHHHLAGMGGAEDEPVRAL
ncbi:MAG: hypothetical protein QM813_04860 [Verrucomicrobiota bacterium]